MVGGGGGGGGGSRGNGAAAPAAAPSSMPASVRKMVQSLKEIVNCPEAEIYAMLKECGMDPDEAVNRLLTQDTFHEVKNKREKKKEMKETPESRPRAVSSSSSHGSRVGGDRGGRSISNQYSSNDHGVSRGKPAIKKENGANITTTTSILGQSIAGSALNQRSAAPSESTSFEGKIHAASMDDGISSTLQPSSGFQHSWMGKPGHVSMADIVKMGRPQGKSSNTSFPPSDTPYASQSGPVPSTSHQTVNHSETIGLLSESIHELSRAPVSQVADVSLDLDTDVGQHISHNNWSLVESSEGRPATPETYGAFAGYANPSASSTLHVEEVDLQLNPHPHEIQVLEKGANESIPLESIQSASVTDRQIQVDDNPENNFQVDEDVLETMISYHPQRHTFEHEEVEVVNTEISSTTTNLQNLRIHEELVTPSAGNKPAVIIPSHLQVTNAECSHLSFGSFGSGINATVSGTYPSIHIKTDLEATQIANDSPSLNKSDVRGLEYYDNSQLQSTSEESLASKTGTSTRNYDTSASEPDVIGNDGLDAAHELQYNLPSVSGYELPTTPDPISAGYSYPQANSQIQNLVPFSSLLQQRTNSLPSGLLAPNVQTLRDFDLPLSPLLAAQSVQTKYNTSVSPLSGSTISTPEVNPGLFAAPQLTPQTLPNTSIPTGPGLPQHLPIHPYSQPTLPLGHFANMISYPFLPQSYSYLPSAAFQQAYAGNGPFHQSAAVVHNAGMKYTLPQYKNSVSVTSLPQSATIPPGYGGFGSSASIPGSFPLNPSSAAASTTLGFDEVLSLQYKEGNQYASHQQNENSPMWLHGTGSRTMSALPSNTFYSLQGQNQQSGYRQSQQPSHFGAMTYPNLYHSPSGLSQEHQQNPTDLNQSGSQGLPSQQSHHTWHHGY